MNTQNLTAVMVVTIIIILYYTGTFSIGSMTDEQKVMYTVIMIPVMTFVLPVILAIEALAFYVAG
jgi:hypothetical protein